MDFSPITPVYEGFSKTIQPCGPTIKLVTCRSEIQSTLLGTAHTSPSVPSIVGSIAVWDEVQLDHRVLHKVLS